LGGFAGIVVKEWLYQITFRVGKEFDSKMIIASAWHHRSDAVSSVVAGLGVLGGMFQVPIIDPIAGVIVSGMIIKTGFSLAIESMKDLTDVRVDTKVIKSIESILKKLKDDGVRGFHQLRGRRLGPYMNIDVHIEVDPKMSVSAAHQVAEKVRLDILEEHPAVSEVMVHVDVEYDVVDDKIREKSFLMRAEKEILKDVLSVLKGNEEFKQIYGITHFTTHFLKNTLTVQLEVAMDTTLRIEEAQHVAAKFGKEITKQIPDVTWADIHLELNPYDIEKLEKRNNPLKNN